jgi:class 3 adenylate cyclase/predicted ATPase
MRCANCGADNRETAKFCDGCGAQLALRCPSCGTANRSGAKFCDSCGNALAASSSVAVGATSATDVQLNTEDAAPEAIEGERKTVTALFADLKGSTELLETLDPEEGRAIIEPLLRIMSDAVRRYEGYLVRTTGDGIFALFGAPVAYEDHPQRALYAALLMQQELRSHGRDQAARGRRTLDARVGVHTGEVVAYAGEASGKVEYRLIGHTANLASRMESIAPPGSIAVSEYTAKLCEGYFELRALGPTSVKGVNEPVDAYEVVAPGPLRTHFELSARRGLTRFVGRGPELAQIERALTQAIEGHGQVVAVVAEAGIGKSRLLYEFKAKIPPTCKVLEAYSVSHGKASAWLPVLELLRNYFGIQEGDDAAARREKLRVAVTALDLSLEDILPYLFGLLGIIDGPDPHAQMDARIKQQRTLEAIKRILLRDSLNQPLVLVFEDLHWIDAHTQGLLDLLADSVASTCVLLLFNYRPEYHHGWSNKSYYTQIRLDPLHSTDGAAMLTALLGDGVELNPLKQLVAERTGGNPFFIEEIVQALFEDGALVRNGSIKVTRSVSQMRLPPTVQGMLAARIDRLPAGQKELLQTLAVIGRESSVGLLRNVVPNNPVQLEQGLGELRSGEFIYEQPALGDTEYVFKHALTQEVGYNSLLIERRKQIHEQVGQAIEVLYSNQLEDRVSALAHHYSRSDNVEKAIEYLGRAGQQAMQRFAYAESIERFTAATVLLAKLPDRPERKQRELGLQLLLSVAYLPVKGWASTEVERASVRARELCHALGDPPEVSVALWGIYVIRLLRAELTRALEIGELLLQSAQKTNDHALLLYAHASIGFAAHEMGDSLSGRRHFEAVVSLYNRSVDHHLVSRFSGADVGVAGLAYLALSLWKLGYPTQALERMNEALALADALVHPLSLHFAQFFLGILYEQRREPTATLASAERLIALCAEHGITIQLAHATAQRGWALTQLGRHEEGFKLLEGGLATLQSIRMNLRYPHHVTLLIDPCIAYGRLTEAEEHLTAAFRSMRENEDRYAEAELNRLQGELLLKKALQNADEAQRCFERAIEVSRQQQGKSFELRATTSLARLLASQGHRDKSRARLAEIYNWFTEGFDTADLKDAKALLDELGT